MKRNIQGEKNNSRKCPWWSQNIGLEQYIRFLLKQNSKYVNFSYFEINPWFLSVLLSQTTTFLNGISFERCEQLSDECIQILSEGFQRRGDHVLKDSLRVNKSHLLQLNLEACVLLTDKSCMSISRYFVRLEHLNIKNCTNIGDEGIISLMRGCKYIADLNISNLFRLHDDSLLAIKQNLVLMKFLRIIDMSGCTGFTDDAILSLFESNPNVLRNIDLSYNPQMQLGISGLHRSNCSQITRLVLEGNHISDSMMKWIGKGCRNLLELQLSRCTGVSSLSLLYLFSCNNIRLKKLNLANSATVTDDTLKAFTKGSGERLEILDLGSCSQVSSLSLIHLASMCPRLEQICLQGTAFCNTGIVELATHCSSLISINISDTKSTRVPRIDKWSFIAIGKYCPLLKILIACGCSRLDNNSITGLTKGCKHIEELGLKRCYKISDRALHAIGRNCGKLRKISLVSCNISTDGVISLIKGCPRLEEIDLSNTLQVTDDAIKVLGNICKNLRVLRLNNCERITNDSIGPLLMTLPLISRFEIRGLDLVSDKAFSGSCLRFLRAANFEGTNVDKTTVKQMESISLFGELTKSNALSIRPIYDSSNMHKQHFQYMQFLIEKQNVIYYCIKRYLFALRCRHCNQIRNESSTKIQTFIRTYLCKTHFKKRLINKVLCDSATLISSAVKKFARGKELERKLYASEIIYRTYYAYRFRLRVNRTVQIHRKQLQRLRIARDKAIWFYISLLILLKRLTRMKRAIVLIQNLWRSFLSTSLKQKKIVLKQRFYYWYKSVSRQERERKIREYYSAICIQDYFTRFQLRRAAIQWVREARRMKKISDDASLVIASFCKRRWIDRQLRIIDRAAETIQSWVRNVNRKQGIKQSWSHIVSKLVLVDVSSRRICIWYRRHVERKRKSKLLLKITMESRQRSVETLQRWFRLMKSERISKSRSIIQHHIIAFGIRKRDRFHEKKRIASVRIQCWIRCILMVRVFQRKLASVSFLQCWWRSQIRRRFFLAFFKQSMSKYNLHQKMKKKLLLEEQRKRKILSLFFRSRWNAALVIQNVVRMYLNEKRRKELNRKREEDVAAVEMFHSLKEAELLKWRQQKQKLAYSTKTAAKKLLNCTIKTISYGVRNMYSIHNEIKKYRTEKHEREELSPKILMYMNGYRGESEGEEVCRYLSYIRDLFREFSWYNRECEDCMLQNLIWPDEVLIFRKLWIEEIDFKREGTVTIHNFYSWIGEPRSEYGFWIIKRFLKDSHSLISFSEYFRLIISSSLLSKYELVMIAFVSVSKHEKFMIKDEWIYFVNSILDNQDRNAFVLKQFEFYASRDANDMSMLLFEDFVSLMRDFPFVMVPMYRFQNNIRRSHAGDSYWRNKIKEISSAKTRSKNITST